MTSSRTSSILSASEDLKQNDFSFHLSKGCSNHSVVFEGTKLLPIQMKNEISIGDVVASSSLLPFVFALEFNPSKQLNEGEVSRAVPTGEHFPACDFLVMLLGFRTVKSPCGDSQWKEGTSLFSFEREKNTESSEAKPSTPQCEVLNV